MTEAKVSADNGALVSTDWLAERLDDADLRIFDCTTYLAYDNGLDQMYRIVSGRSDYEAGHIPGAGFLDLQKDFSDNDSPYTFTLPAPEVLARAFEAHGIGDGLRIVLYCRESPQWATRFWWMLRFLGVDSVAVLDGGFDKWQAEGRRLESGSRAYPPGSLSTSVRPGLVADRDEVLAAIGRPDVCTLNAMRGDLHRGENARHGRPGRVPGSVNVPAPDLLLPGIPVLRPADQAARAFAEVGADADKRIITYCGGGIAATLDAFVLHLLGHRDVAVYDNSMSEWAIDPALPIETG